MGRWTLIECCVHYKGPGLLRRENTWRAEPWGPLHEVFPHHEIPFEGVNTSCTPCSVARARVVAKPLEGKEGGREG